MRIIAITRDLGNDERRQRVVEHLRAKCEIVRLPPRMSGFSRVLNLALSYNPQRQIWREQSKKNAFFFASMSRGIRRSLAGMGREIGDIVMTFEALFAPGIGRGMVKPYVIYEDCTSRMTVKRWPSWIPKTARTPRYRQLEEQCYRSAAHIFTTSNWVRDSLLSDYGLPVEQVTNVGQGHDLERPAALSPCNGPIVFVGYEFERKGGPLLLEAFRRILAVHPAARLSIVGADLSVSIPGVKVYGKVSDKAELQGILHNSCMFVLPSIFDPNPHAAMEAMAMGLPVIVSDACGTQEIIQNEESGYVVPVSDVDSLSRCIEKLITDRGRRQRIGRAGAIKVYESSDWSLVADRIADRLSRLK